MKFKKIEISNYYQFNNISFEFTYPKGHPKAGKPLEKVCFIGQSASGKTTLLRLLKELTKIAKEKIEQFDGNSNPNIHVVADVSGSEYSFDIQNKKIEHSARNIGNVGKNLKNIETSYIYIPADIRHDIDFEENIVEEISNQQKSINKEYIDLSGEDIRTIWTQIMHRLVAHQENEMEYRVNLTFEKAADIFEKIDQWKHENKSPLEKIADTFLREILLVFDLEIDLEIKRIDSLNFIQLKRKNSSQIIPFDKLSTGTKQIILSLVPLFELNTNNSVILVDEPERSLYPDVQQSIIKNYTQLAPHAQFFFATHSPLIAAQFEPFERFILEFDNDGFTKIKQGFAPEGDDPNDFLVRDFGLDSVLTQKGLEKWEEFIDLRQKIKFEKNEDEKVELINQYLELGTSYNFILNEKNY
jgi:predicted ATPase